MGILPVYDDAIQGNSITQVFSEWDSLSGMVASQKNIGIIWGANDGSGTVSLGGTKPEFCAVNRSGDLKGRYTFDVVGEGGGNEDLALGPGPTSGVHYIYLGPNMGGSNVTTGRICRVPEPTLTENGAYQGVSGSIDVPGADSLDFSFGDGNSHTCECFLFDPISKDLYIVTKGQNNNTSDTGKVFKFPYPQATSGTTSINLVADLDIDLVAGATLLVSHDSQSPPRPTVTGGDISSDGNWIVIRTRSQDAWVWKRPVAGLIEDAWGSGAASNRKGAGALPIIVKDGQESCCFAHFKAQNFTVGNNTDDGTPGGIYGARESADKFWYNVESQQPGGGGSPDSTGWLGGVVPIR